MSERAADIFRKETTYIHAQVIFLFRFLGDGEKKNKVTD